MSNILSFILLFLFSMKLYSAEVKVRFDPVSPLVDETFRMIVDVETSQNGKPYISFNPGRAEVIQRMELGTTSQTTIINGQISSKRIYSFAYDLVADSAGSLRITNFLVEIDSKTTKVADQTVNIVRERAAPRSYFVRADLPKTELYVGEGVNVDYYLYFRVPVVGMEILDFPKLNGFIKRFYMTSDQYETIEEGGTLFRRRKAYSARVFAEKEGRLIIDPIKLRIQYTDQPSGGSFSGFGFQTRQHQTRSVQSDPVTITVKPLPTENLPKHFTGLVGKHDFKLDFPRDRFLVNEAVDFSLEVTGGGALENMSAPKFLNIDALEEFDIKSEMREVNEAVAKKTFSYTYLARAAHSSSEQSIKFAYFDPESEKYIDVEFKVPAIVISGGSAGAVSADNSLAGLNKEDISPVRVATPSVSYQFLAPRFTESSRSFINRNMLRLINTIISILIIVLLLISVIKFKSFNSNLKRFELLKQKLKKEGMDFRTLFELISCMAPDGKTVSTSRDLLQNSALSAESKEYFCRLLEQIEKVVLLQLKN